MYIPDIGPLIPPPPIFNVSQLLEESSPTHANNITGKHNGQHPDTTNNNNNNGEVFECNGLDNSDYVPSSPVSKTVHSIGIGDDVAVSTSDYHSVGTETIPNGHTASHSVTTETLSPALRETQTDTDSLLDKDEQQLESNWKDNKTKGILKYSLLGHAKLITLFSCTPPTL